MARAPMLGNVFRELIPPPAEHLRLWAEHRKEWNAAQNSPPYYSSNISLTFAAERHLIGVFLQSLIAAEQPNPYTNETVTEVFRIDRSQQGLYAAALSNFIAQVTALGYKIAVAPARGGGKRAQAASTVAYHMTWSLT